MYSLLETLIHLLAIMGIIFTTVSFLGIFNSNIIYQNSYRFCSRNNMKDKKIEIVICVENLTEEEEAEILDTILTGNYTDIKDITNSVKIERL